MTELPIDDDLAQRIRAELDEFVGQDFDDQAVINAMGTKLARFLQAEGLMNPQAYVREIQTDEDGKMHFIIDVPRDLLPND